MLSHQIRFPASALLVCLLLVSWAGESVADVRLPSVFSDHMVLQQKQKLRVWGWADAGEEVRVELGPYAATTQPNETGRWEVELPKMEANAESQTLRVKGNNTVEINDVLIGEVWLCSGQSNMEWTVSRSTDAENEIASANYPLIRHIKIPKTAKFLPQDDVPAKWEVCSPKTVGQFTACGYFMARHLHKELNVPIGLVNSSWGGTRVEPWTPPVGFERVPALENIYQDIMGRTPGTELYKNRLSSYIEATESWIDFAKQALNENELLTPSTNYPDALKPFTSHQSPTMLYNAMIHPILGFPIRGAIWYQGESNHREGMLYVEKKKALINGWRELWKQGDFPFYFVQIGPYHYGEENPRILAQFWEAQAAVQQIPNTGMVVINDIATLNDIHPPNKQDVGKRLALWALKNDYGQTDIVAANPEMESLEVLDDHLRVVFKNTGGGLTTRDGESPTYFEIIGPGSAGFQPATAEIDGDAVLLKSADVEHPVAFRFAWHKLAEPNLMGGTGLPVGAVRGGTLPDIVDTLPMGKDYRLVYDLDLAKLGSKIQYDTDQSGSINMFDRVAYLLELITADGEQQVMFVSMDAFTDDAKKIGIPTLESGASFQQYVESLEIVTNVEGLQSRSEVAKGNIEFWPSNYRTNNTSKIKGASDVVYDCGDSPAEPHNGYGSMQVHDFEAKQTLFAINHWKNGAGADLGIGNSTGETKDWTFNGNAGSYENKRLRVYVRVK
ncbi:sialate O-acetylesterase [Calycomorphotria hydatis]|uniref:Sialate O-acetylesterase domain-containing protein n=1 Tax=Calycomorphotria hydatis TaxID=2528027 RepID=A0A517T913_9PLAN|nr:sialate O-acetylesterase [Calycomorphotria hydatis]QDT64874.1 hypothetical protein V22_21170 [Calycomorphotria hydatis]